jgi:hypothetical protein
MEAQSVLDQPQGRKAWRFLRHLLEMIVVMMLGMCVLGAAWGAFHEIVFGSAFADAWRDYVGLAAFAMAFNMTVPMVLWMRYRGHSWERGGEMAIAMNLPSQTTKSAEPTPRRLASQRARRAWAAAARLSKRAVARAQSGIIAVL